MQELWYPMKPILDKINEKLRPPLPPFQWWKEWRALVRPRVHHWFGGRGGFISHFILSKIAILDKINEKLRPPLPPFQWWKKWRALVRPRVHHWFGGRGGFISHFILSKIVDENHTCFGYRIQTTRCFHLIPHWISRFTHQNKRN